MKTTEPVITGPYACNNLDVFLIHGQDAVDTSHYITLEEALDQKKMVVHETGNVGELMIENLLDDKDIFIQAGEIVRGGRQDRTLGVDFILPARTGKVPIPSFCVESGRWHARGGEGATAFGSSRHYLSSRELKLAAKLACDQHQVWNQVAETQEKLSRSVRAPVNDERSASSLELTLDHENLRRKMAEGTAALLKLIEGQPDSMGFVFAINGQINSGEVYASRDLFRRLWKKLAEAALVEAISEEGGRASKARVTKRKIQNFLKAAEVKSAERRELPPRAVLYIRRASKQVQFETMDTAVASGPIHRSYIYCEKACRAPGAYAPEF